MFFIYLNKMGCGVLWQREGGRGYNFQRGKCNIQKNLFFFFLPELDHISMYFYSSFQSGAGDTLVN